MRPLSALLVYVLAVFLGGALLAPWLYQLCQSIPWLAQLAANPFSGFVNRSLIFFALVGLWPLLRKLGIRTAEEVGLTSLQSERRRLLQGFFLGFITLALLVSIILLFHGRTLNSAAPAGKYAKHLAIAALSAVTVAVLEEILFRGGIFGALRRIFNWRLALVVSSAVYAILHFFQTAMWVGPVTWHSGLEMLPRMAAGFIDFQRLIPGFLNLTLVGAILALAYQRTGNLWFSIGLHGGWVFWLKFNNFLTKTPPDSDIRFWGSSRMIDGWMISAVLIATLATAHLILKPKPTQSHGIGG